jgi:hypothetical protein
MDPGLRRDDVVWGVQLRCDQARRNKRRERHQQH